MRLNDLPKHLQEKLGLKSGHKYGVKSGKLERTEDGIVFASKLEARIYRSLCRNLKAGKSDGENRRSIVYVADFLVGTLCHTREGEASPVPENCLVLDAKGFSPAMYRVKSKMFEAKFGCGIRLIKSAADLNKIPWSDFGIELKNEIFF